MRVCLSDQIRELVPGYRSNQGVGSGYAQAYARHELQAAILEIFRILETSKSRSYLLPGQIPNIREIY